MSSNKVIVVGGGLAGLSAAHTVLERGGKVVIIDKNPFLGGNSTKATSGINGALTNTQIGLGIKDSAEAFYEDTARSARDLIRPPLVKVLTHNSGSAVEWLKNRFELDLSLVSRLGGHSFPRTHRGKEKFPGMTITYALMEKLEDIASKEPNQVKLIKKAKCTRLLQDGNGNVIGIEFEHNGKVAQEHGVVVLATGGYAADFAQDGLIRKYRPDVYDLPTTNGDWSTGDGLKMSIAIGANSIDMEKVQVHPTGLVDPNEPDAKLKFLAAEALRGCGGLLIDANGKRFADELGHRDYVTGEMWKNKGPFRLVLNGAAAKEIEWHCKHYMGRGLMKHFKTGADLAKEMGIDVAVLDKTFSDYNGFAKNKNDPFGKKFFHNMPVEVKDQFHVAIVTPVVHYCMGGLEIDDQSRVIAKAGPIQGLFACGELGGGVHGANRLGGSSLLGCVVYGRVAGESATKYLLNHLAENHGQAQTSAERRSGAIGAHVGGSLPQITVSNGDWKVTIDISHNGDQVTTTNQTAPVNSVNTVNSTASSSASSTSSTSAPAAEPAKPAVDTNKEISMEEVAKHKTEKDCWVVVNGQVLDVTNFLADHPGGKKAILIYAGRDATEEFNMLHKPDVVDKYAPECIIGRVKGATSHGPQGHHTGGSTNPANNDVGPSTRAKL